MKLAEGEEKVAEYYFAGLLGGQDVSNMSILTTRRLVVVYQNAEESYPLSKITSVRHVHNRSWGKIVIGWICLVSSLTLRSQGIVPVLIVALFGGVLMYLGWRGLTRLLVSSQGGERYYEVRGKDPKLMGFIEEINGRLS